MKIEEIKDEMAVDVTDSIIEKSINEKIDKYEKKMLGLNDDCSDLC